jgi:hypothetical protein
VMTLSEQTMPFSIPQTKVSRCETVKLQRPQNRSISFYAFLRVVRTQKLLYVADKTSKSYITHKPHSLSHCQWYILQELINIPLKNESSRSLTDEAVAHTVLWERWQLFLPKY